jgi:5'-nucleotidase
LSKPTVLLSNDDGVHAPGLKALHRELTSIGDVTVVAPDRERSAASHSLTIDVPLRANKIADDVVSVEGTPTDCVLLAIRNLLPKPPDILVSGINRGPNLGDDVTYSGTVAAAMEGTLLGIPSIAVSLDRSPKGDFDYAHAARIARELASVVLDRGLPAGTLLNVNVPNVPPEEITGIAVARLGKQVYEDEIVQKTDPRGRGYYWIGGQETTWHAETGTDFAAIAQGLVSVTPIHLDLTDYGAVELLSTWPLDTIASRAADDAAETPSRTAGEEREAA